MTNMVELTIQDKDAPTVWVNPAQVVVLRPRKGFKPDVASQTAGVASFWSGSEIALSNGTYLNVIEDVLTVRNKLFPQATEISDKLFPDKPGVDMRSPVKTGAPKIESLQSAAKIEKPDEADPA